MKPSKSSPAPPKASIVDKLLDLPTIAWKSIRQRGVASLLTTLSMALGVTLVVAVLVAHGVISKSFRSQASFGYNIIAGAKGGKLQLTLNTVYYLSEPIENVPFDFYLELLDEERRVEYGAEARPGKYSDYAKLVIPLALGDYFGRFRVVGTTPEMFDKLKYGDAADRSFEFAAGRNFEHKSKEHGFFEAVVGATVAREMDVQVGDEISPSHGAPEEDGGSAHEDEFTVVGILEPTGTPTDRAVYVNMEGFFLMEGHATEATEVTDQGKGAVDRQPLPLRLREVTSMLVQTENSFHAAALHRAINKGDVAQAVYPVQEIYSLFEYIVGPVNRVLLLLTLMICLVSGISILVSIYNSMSDRRREIAIMRALGARRGQIMAIVLLESIILSLGGGLLGWFSGHALIASYSEQIRESTGVTIGLFDLAPGIEETPLYEGSDLVFSLPFSTELLLIPGLILLAIIVGFWPAVTAYRTDVSRSLSP